MIVRDEAAVIERCLASVRPFIDSWVIVDTGSLDDTPRRIESNLCFVLPAAKSAWSDLLARDGFLGPNGHGSSGGLRFKGANRQ